MAELHRAQVNGISWMHIWRAYGYRETGMNDPGAQQPNQMFDLGKGQTTTTGPSCPTLHE